MLIYSTDTLPSDYERCMFFNINTNKNEQLQNFENKHEPQF